MGRGTEEETGRGANVGEVKRHMKNSPAWRGLPSDGGTVINSHSRGGRSSAIREDVLGGGTAMRKREINKRRDQRKNRGLGKEKGDGKNKRPGMFRNEYVQKLKNRRVPAVKLDLKEIRNTVPC